MPALNFSSQFADAVESGRKTQSIRALRKRPFQVGDKLFFYTGMRTKQCRKLGEGIIVSVDEIKIDGLGILINKHCIPIDFDKFAKADGFNSWQEMYDWFQKTHGLPFAGQLIRWELLCVWESFESEPGRVDYISMCGDDAPHLQMSYYPYHNIIDCPNCERNVVFR